MAVSTPTISADRPASATAATAALVLNAIANLMNVGGYLSGAPIPPSILAIEIVLGIGAIVAAGGLRGRQRWAVPAALVLSVLNIVLGGMGIFTAGSTTGKAVAATGALLGLVVLALVAAGATRRATA
jgi:hypothetical protein